MLKKVLATVLAATMAITPATAIQAKAHKCICKAQKWRYI